MLRDGDSAWIMGCSWEWVEFWELFKDEDFNGGGFFAYEFRTGFKDSERVEEVSTEVDNLRLFTEAWVVDDNSGLFGVFDCEEMADQLRRRVIYSTFYNKLDAVTLFGMEREEKSQYFGFNVDWEGGGWMVDKAECAVYFSYGLQSHYTYKSWGVPDL